LLCLLLSYKDIENFHFFIKQSDLCNFAEVFMTEGIKTWRILRAALVIANTALCRLMQPRYFAFSGKLSDT